MKFLKCKSRYILFIFSKLFFFKKSGDFCFLVCHIKNKIDAKNKIEFSMNIYNIYDGNFMMLVISSDLVDQSMRLYGDPFRYMKINNIDQISEDSLKKLSNNKNFVLCMI